MLKHKKFNSLINLVTVMAKSYSLELIESQVTALALSLEYLFIRLLIALSFNVVLSIHLNREELFFLRIAIVFLSAYYPS